MLTGHLLFLQTGQLHKMKTQECESWVFASTYRNIFGPYVCACADAIYWELHKSYTGPVFAYTAWQHIGFNIYMYQCVVVLP